MVVKCGEIVILRTEYNGISFIKNADKSVICIFILFLW